MKNCCLGYSFVGELGLYQGLVFTGLGLESIPLKVTHRASWHEIWLICWTERHVPISPDFCGGSVTLFS